MAPMIRPASLTGSYDDELGIKDVSWISAPGAEMESQDWENALTRCFGMLMDGRAQVSGIRKNAHDATVLLIVNSHHDVVLFTLPAQPGGTQWTLLVDTNRSAAPVDLGSGEQYQDTGRCLLLFALRANAAD